MSKSVGDLYQNIQGQFKYKITDVVDDDWCTLSENMKNRQVMTKRNEIYEASLLKKLLKMDLSVERDADRECVCRNAMFSSNRKLKAVWSYNLLSHKLEYSAIARGYKSGILTVPKDPRSDSICGWVRGRVFEEDEKDYILIFLDLFDWDHGPVQIDRDLLTRSICDLYSLIRDNFEYLIYDFVDDHGSSLTKSKKKK